MKRLLLATLFCICGLAAAAATYSAVQDAPQALLPREGASVVKAALVDRRQNPLSVTYQNGLNYNDYVPLHEVPPQLLTAFVVSEDKRFFEHGGIDWRARAAAVYQNLSSFKKIRGASTITEQTVRILRERPRSLWSRWIEGWEARLFERKFSKAEILEFYLNQVPFSARRRGISQAARYYFDRDLGTLNLKEQLALVALVRAPSRFDPYKGQKLLETRIADLCRALERAGNLQPACAEIGGDPLELRRPGEPIDASHFVRFASTQIRGTGGAHKLETTLDGGLQSRLQKLLDGHIRANAAHNAHDGAILVLDHRANEVLAWVNSGRADPEVHGSFIDAVLAPRQPGSTLKPFLYALALEHGWTPATILDDAPIVQAVGTGAHSYRNYSRVFYGPVRLRDALGNSLNTPAVRAIGFVGVSRFLDFLHRLGLRSLDKSWEFYGEGLALGNGEVTLYDLTQAYAALARGGLAAEPQLFYSAAPSRGELTRVVSAQASALIADILSDPNARRLEFSRGGLLGFSHQIAVKTGTSTDFRDLWAFGFSDRFTVGVWMGNLNREAMNDITSSSGPGLVLRSVFHQLGRLHEPRALPAGSSVTRLRICSVSGELAGPNCPAMDELFDQSNVPGHVCSEHSGARTAPSLARGLEDRVPQVSFPTPGLQVARDPRIPDDLEALALSLKEGGRFTDVKWFLDGREIGKGKGPHNRLTWRIEPGKHAVWASAALTENDSYFQSAPVNFIVK